MIPIEPFEARGARVPGDPAAAATLLVGLNPVQREAVSHAEGPALVLAGAGSGKTRVITHRVAHLILVRGVAPWEIVAVTFTNKAAGEMRGRVERLVGGRRAGSWIGTFHALCLRILRRDGERVGLEAGFNIYDTDDQLALVRRLMREDSTDDGAAKARPVLSRISRAKNALETPGEVERRAFSADQRTAARIYRQYDDALRRANAVDFDDLLVRTLELFREHPDVLRRYAERCRHLLVDEYQDTNRPQYLLVRALSSVHGNLFVVGDEDQSIYRFRGAEIRNILDFEHDHPGARVIRLEQNYRSTATILGVAGAVIENNVHRKGKKLWTENLRGDPVELYRAPDDRAEAAWVSGRVRALAGASFDDVAVLYRTNAQSRQFEEFFRRDRIPYQVVGSVQFYERKEVKDLLAYLKLIANPADDVSFRRIVNTPARAIGAGTLESIDHVARTLGVPLLRAAAHAIEHDVLPTRAARAVGSFLDLASELSRWSEEDTVAALLERILERTDYARYLERAYPDQVQDRLENVRALVSAAVEYHEEDEGGTLLGFLDRSALVSDADDVGAAPGVTLMTIHCAKGLEFRHVFLVGLEENLFPHVRATESRDDLEEERRLCYVAMTRARETLVLTLAGFRRMQGNFMPNAPSRFLDEIPRDLVRDVTPDPTSLYERRASWDGDSARSPGSSAARAAARANGAGFPPPVRVRSEPAPEDGFAVGVRIRHPNFGAGQIVDREGSGRSLKLTIQFRDVGRKKILPAYTELLVEH